MNSKKKLDFISQKANELLADLTTWARNQKLIKPEQSLRQFIDIRTSLNGIPLSPSSEIVDIENVEVSSLNLSVRAQNICASAGLTTVGHLKNRTAKEILKLRNSGRKTVVEISQKLESLGIIWEPAFQAKPRTQTEKDLENCVVRKISAEEVKMILDYPWKITRKSIHKICGDPNVAHQLRKVFSIKPRSFYNPVGAAEGINRCFRSRQLPYRLMVVDKPNKYDRSTWFIRLVVLKNS